MAASAKYVDNHAKTVKYVGNHVIKLLKLQRVYISIQIKISLKQT